MFNVAYWILVSCVGENTTNKTDNQNAYQGVNIETIMVKHTKGETEVNKKSSKSCYI